mgnify:CR=1 FL=1
MLDTLSTSRPAQPASLYGSTGPLEFMGPSLAKLTGLARQPRLAKMPVLPLVQVLKYPTVELKQLAVVDLNIEAARTERCTPGEIEAGTCETKLKTGVSGGV